jgi:hypothetical protein
MKGVIIDIMYQIFILITSRMRWTRHAGRVGRMRNAYRVLVGKPKGKRQPGRTRRRGEDNIKMNLEDVRYNS